MGTILIPTNTNGTTNSSQFSRPIKLLGPKFKVLCVLPDGALKKMIETQGRVELIPRKSAITTARETNLLFEQI